MDRRTFHYEELTASQLAELDRENTLALMALSPLEVHGPHLPLGTDVMVATELQKTDHLWDLRFVEGSR
jgi:creatinine amidohydrolase